MRLDEYVAASKQISKSKAQDMIQEKFVLVNELVMTKKAYQIKEGDQVDFVIQENPVFVSRSGNKLYHALLETGVEVLGKTCLDVGASTGGFSDCCLQLGAKKVFALDVGSDQLDQSLKGDTRLVSLEQFNVRDLTVDTLGGLVDFVCCDVSFISLHKIISPMIQVGQTHADYFLLFKPQFECGKRYLNKHGVVKDLKIIETILSQFIDSAQNLGLQWLKTLKSSVIGRSGNQEYILYFRKR